MVEFEHAIFILLVLLGVLNAKPPRQHWTPWIIVGGILLAFIPPSHALAIPWDIVLGLVIPLILWQNARRLVESRWRGWKGVALYIFAALAFGIALGVTDVLKWPGAVLFGLITASIMWRAGEFEKTPFYLSQIGPITLIFLLAEVESAIAMPNQYIGSIFSGAALGVGSALLALRLSRNKSAGIRNWLAIGQAYLAYWAAFVIGVSAVAAALVSALVFIWVDLYFGLWYKDKPLPAPLNTWPGFITLLTLFLVLSWQAHQPISLYLLIEVLVGAIFALIIAWIGHRVGLLSYEKPASPWLAGARVVLLLFPALLLWPRGALQEPLQLAIAFVIAATVIGLSTFSLSYFFPSRKY